MYLSISHLVYSVPQKKGIEGWWMCVHGMYWYYYISYNVATFGRFLVAAHDETVPFSDDFCCCIQKPPFMQQLVRFGEKLSLEYF